MLLKQAVVAIMLASTISSSVPAQTMPDGSANRAAIERLGFMVGTWRGSGWMMIGRQRENARIVETVQLKSNGTVLLIEGLGTAAEPNGGERVVHSALGVLAWDAQNGGGYVMRSWVMSGFWGDFPVTPIEGGVSWARDVPGGRVRYVARIGNGEWHETGEFTRDGGTTWMPIMELRLRKDP